MYAVASYTKPNGLAQALELLGARPDAKILAGGTDLLVKLREQLQPLHLVDISELPELGREGLDTHGTVLLGAGLSFARLAASPLVKAHVPLLAEAALSVAGPQIRNQGTLGGNLCNGAVSADLAAPLLVLDAELRLAGPEGERVLPLRDFHLKPGTVGLKPGEILVTVAVPPANYRNAGMAWFKYATRAAMDIATIGCAAWVRAKDGKLDELKLAFSVAGPRPLRCVHAEAAARAKTLNADTLQAIAQAVEADVSPRSSWRADKEFRLHIIRTLARKMTVAAAGRAGLNIAEFFREEA